MLEYSVGSSMDRKDYMRSSLIFVFSLLNLSFRSQKVGQYSFYAAPENTYIYLIMMNSYSSSKMLKSVF